MIENLVKIDAAFTSHYRKLLAIQKGIFAAIKSYPFDLSKAEITEAIYARMMAFWYFNVHNNKEILNRKVNTVAADFFTETTLLFLKGYFEKDGITVYSEEMIGGLRPDISIWKGNEVVAVIELKVNDGWKRKDMLAHLEEREKKIKEIAPNAYFGVLSFWNFFDVSTPNWNTKYFGLYNYSNDDNHQRVGCIETLIIAVNKCISNPNPDGNS